MENDNNIYNIDYKEIDFLKRKFNRKLKRYKSKNNPWLIEYTLKEI